MVAAVCIATAASQGPPQGWSNPHTWHRGIVSQEGDFTPNKCFMSCNRFLAERQVGRFPLRQLTEGYRSRVLHFMPLHSTAVG